MVRGAESAKGHPCTDRHIVTSGWDDSKLPFTRVTQLGQDFRRSRPVASSTLKISEQRNMQPNARYERVVQGWIPAGIDDVLDVGLNRYPFVDSRCDRKFDCGFRAF